MIIGAPDLKINSYYLLELHYDWFKRQRLGLVAQDHLFDKVPRERYANKNQQYDATF